MSAKTILNDDWSEYDNRKIRGGSDRRKFACTESWEVDYLADKIHKKYPNISKATIKAAITTCCNTTTSRERDEFVACVTKRLGLQ